MRKIIPMNNDWFYSPDFCEKDISAGTIDRGKFESIRLPHANIELPYNYFDDKAFQFVSCYKKELNIPADWKGQKVFVDFEGVMSYAKVYLGETFAGEHKGGYTPFSIDITDLAAYGEKNVLTVVVDSTERDDTPPFGGVIDYLTYGGIYREVQLRVVSPAHIVSIFAKTPNALAEQKSVQLTAELAGITPEIALTAGVKLMDGETVKAALSDIPVQDNTLSLELNDLEGLHLWEPDSPQLYQLELTLKKENQPIDFVSTRIGFREAEFRTDGFYLNSHKLKLRGLNRHQAYPYVGYAMPKRVQQKDADIMKNEIGLNMVRTSHYPQSRHFIDRCDEIGLLVFEEIPGWQYIGNEEWKQQVLRDVEEMIVRDRNHPSIVIWGVRINESQDDHDLYTKTNALARELDPTRPTGGVRYLTGSDFLEDVYTMNDFIHDGGHKKYLAKVIRNYETYDQTADIDGEFTALRDPSVVTQLDHAVPYMVTEYNGHMYPTKRFDQEERMMEHALRHARVQNASYANDGIAGAVGWCAFDYNTHADFGSGDKICYHGVMDMYRLPKFAAYAYRSQKPASDEVVLQPVTYWCRGERSIGGIVPLVIFTNCDEIEFFYGNEKRGTYKPDREKFPALPHPPVIIDELAGYWGMEWEGGTFVGYVGGKEVVRKQFSRNPVPTQMRIEADDTVLDAGDMDATRIVVEALDECENVLPFLMEPICIEVKGVGELIGPEQLSLIGGQIAFWVRTTGAAGEISIGVDSARFGKQSLTISVQ